MSERLKLFWLGVFIILTLIFLGWLLLLLRPSYGDAKTELRVRFSNIENISPGTQVVFAGKPVGEVVKINMIPNARGETPSASGDLYFYELILKVDSAVKVYSYDKISYATSGLLGEKSISIVPRAAPKGDSPPEDISETVLYGDSTDHLQETLDELIDIGRKIEYAIDDVGDFLRENQEEILCTFESLRYTSDEFGYLLHHANDIHIIDTLNQTGLQATKTLASADYLIQQALDQHLINRLSSSLSDISQITNNINAGQGTLGRLVQSDCLYTQLSSTLSHIETLICDISNYGLLFQYNKKWQRLRASRVCAMQRLCTPCDFYQFLNEETCQISYFANNLNDVIERMECQDIHLDTTDLTCRVQDLLEQVQRLERNLSSCN